MYNRLARSGYILAVCVLFGAPATFADGLVQTLTKPLKVYLLAGQSNMQGKGKLSTLPYMAKYPACRDLYNKIVDETGTPRVHDGVSIVYFTKGDTKRGVFRPLVVTNGLLSVGFGAQVGPELAFGITMGEHTDEPILLIKTAWGGKSLYRSFRPPSAGARPVELTDTEWGERVATWKAEGVYDQEIAALKLRMKDKNYGTYYHLMIGLIRDALSDPAKYCAAYNPKLGYEIGGFIWFQGFNDGRAPYPANNGGDKDHTEYSRLLSCFIRDVRKDLNAPEMPFVIGVIGIGGEDHHDPLRPAMAAPADMPEFKGNVAAVETARFWDNDLSEAANAAKTWERLLLEPGYDWEEGEVLNGAAAFKTGWVPIGKPGPDERQWRYHTFELDPKTHPAVNTDDGDPASLLGAVPDELKGWADPGFDDSAWQAGPAPVGKGKWRSRSGTVPNRSEWGEKTRLLMRTTFEVDDLDYSAYRLIVLARNENAVYLNGRQIRHETSVSKQPLYVAVNMQEEHAKLLRAGSNVLAVYATQGDRPFCAVDAFIDGINEEGQVRRDQLREEIYPAKYEGAHEGIGDGGYHYMGSVKIYSRIGEALANALIGMQAAAGRQGER